MRKKLTITVDEAVYHGLHQKIGPGRISQFLEDLARPHVVGDNLDMEYAAMAADESRETDALAWIEEMIDDIADGPR